MASIIVINGFNIIGIYCLFFVVVFGAQTNYYWKQSDDKIKCPKVKGLVNFDVSEFLGSWKIIQYYASSEEALAYKCMRAELSLSDNHNEITMNFTYNFIDDPINECVFGNITWKIPHYNDSPAHWIHTENPYEEIYNTYVLATDYNTWALLMHCAEKKKSPRYMSSYIMSRQNSLEPNAISYLREKLTRYDIDLEYMFSMKQSNCNHTIITNNNNNNNNNSYLALPMVQAARDIYQANQYKIQD